MIEFTQANGRVVYIPAGKVIAVAEKVTPVNDQTATRIYIDGAWFFDIDAPIEGVVKKINNKLLFKG